MLLRTSTPKYLSFMNACCLKLLLRKFWFLHLHKFLVTAGLCVVSNYLQGAAIDSQLFKQHRNASELLNFVGNAPRVEFMTRDLGMTAISPWFVASIAPSLQVTDLELLYDNVLVGYVDGFIRQEDSSLGGWKFVYGFGARSKGALRDQNWDIRIDFGGDSSGSYVEKGNQGSIPSISWNLIPIGLDPWPIIPIAEFPGGDPQNNLWKQYTKSESDLQLLPMDKQSIGGLQAAVALLSTVGKKVKFPQVFAKNLPIISLDIDKVIHEESKGIWGLKGGVYLGGSGSFPGNKGFLGEFSCATIPDFALNSIGLGMDNMDIGIPITLDTVYWQKVFGSIENIQLPPWYLHADAKFTFGTSETQIPLIGYPFDVTGDINVKSNGYMEATMQGHVLGFTMSEAGVTLDPSNYKFKFYFTDMPNPPIFLNSGSIAVTKSSFSADISSRIGIPSGVPIIGGFTLAGVDVGIENRDQASVWDIHGQFGYTIVPAVPEVCVDVPTEVHVSTPHVWWDSCCWDTFLGCVGCAKIDLLDKIEIHNKHVCTPAVPEVSAEFRVGILVSGNGVNPYFDQKGAYNPMHRRFQDLYLAPYREWETPFYYHTVDEKGRIAYYNYNWDRMAKQYFPTQNIFPLLESS